MSSENGDSGDKEVVEEEEAEEDEELEGETDAESEEHVSEEMRKRKDPAERANRLGS